MSQFGVFMLMLTIVLGLVGMVVFFAWLTDLREQGGIGAAVRDGVDRYVENRRSARQRTDTFRALKSAESVKSSIANPLITPPDIMSRPETTTACTDRTERTNARTDEGSSHDRAWQEFLLDRTRERLVAVMVDSDMTVTEIRALLKGESATIGQEIEAAKQRLGKPPSQPYRTPIAGRMTDAKYYQDEPELQYQAPPN